jgi:hypothetical protein
MIGTTRSRVSHFMNKFRKSGFIDYNGKIEVHQSLLNSLLHDKPQIREDEPSVASSPRNVTSSSPTWMRPYSDGCGESGAYRASRREADCN